MASACTLGKYRAGMGLKSAQRIGAAALFLAAVLGCVAARADPVVIEGPAEVIDSTTLEIWGQRIRLAGLAAPDPRSGNGREGKRFLQELLAGIRVRCQVEEPSFSLGLWGRCVAANVDIAERLVQMGYAQSARR